MRRAFLSATFGRYIVLLARAASMVVLARLLAPEDFGAFAVALAIVALATAPAGFGLVSYLVRHPRPGRAERAVAVGLSAVLTGAVVPVLIAITLVLPERVLPAEVGALVLVLSLGLLSGPFSIPALAMLQREMRFGTLATIDVARTLVQIAYAIALPAAGFGALALALAALLEQVLGALLVMAVAGRRALARPSLRGWRDLVAFGRAMTFAGGLSTVGDSTTTLIIGKLLGIGAVGVFNRATTLVQMGNRAIVNGAKQVVLPALVREQAEQGDFRRAYLAKVAFLTALHWPFFGFVALYADALVDLILGPGWDAAVGPVQALCVMGLFLPFTQLSMKFFVALDVVGEYVRLQAVTQIARVVMTAAGALVSLEAACLMFALASHGVKAVLVTPPLKRRIGYSPRLLAVTLLRGALLAAASLAGPAVAASLLPGGIGTLALAAALSAVGWLAGVYAVRHPAAVEITALVRGVLARLSAAAARSPASGVGS